MAMKPRGYAKAGGVFALVLSVLLVAMVWYGRGGAPSGRLVLLNMGAIALATVTGTGMGYLTGWLSVRMQDWIRNR